MTLAAEESSDVASIANAAVTKAVNMAQIRAKEYPKVSFRLLNISVDHTYLNGQIQKDWRANALIQIEGSDMTSVAALAASLSENFQTQSVTYGLSAVARKSLQDDLVVKAATQFQVDAQTAAQALGYSGYVIKDVTINRSEQISNPRMYGATAKGGAPNLPTVNAAGESEASVTIDGAVFLKLSTTQ